MDESTPTCDERFRRGRHTRDGRSTARLRELIVTTPASPSRSVARSSSTRRSANKQPTESHSSPYSPRRDHPRHQVEHARASWPAIAAGDRHRRPRRLRDRLAEYAELGARFAKWRAVSASGTARPAGDASRPCRGPGRYGGCARRRVSSDRRAGSAHDGSTRGCCDLTEDVLRTVFVALHSQGVVLEAALKPNIGATRFELVPQENGRGGAEATARCLLRTVPVRGSSSCPVAIPELASARLNALNLAFPTGPPWALLVLVRSRHPAAGTRDLARRPGTGRSPSRCSPTGPMQPGSAARQLLGGNGGVMNVKDLAHKATSHNTAGSGRVRTPDRPTRTRRRRPRSQSQRLRRSQAQSLRRNDDLKSLPFRR